MRNCCRFLHNFTKELRVGLKIRPPISYFFESEEEKERYKKWVRDLDELTHTYKYGDVSFSPIPDKFSSVNKKNLTPIFTNFGEEFDQLRPKKSDCDFYFSKTIKYLQNISLFNRILLKRMNKEKLRRRWMCNIIPLRFIELSRMKNGIDKMKPFELQDKYHRPICKYYINGRCQLTSQFNKKIKKVKKSQPNEKSNNSTASLRTNYTKKQNVVALTPLQTLEKATDEYDLLVQKMNPKDSTVFMISNFPRFKEKYSINLPKKIDNALIKEASFEVQLDPDVKAKSELNSLVPYVAQDTNNNNYFKYNKEEIAAKFKDKYLEPKVLLSDLNSKKYLNSIELTEEEENNSDYEDNNDDEYIKNILLFDKSQAASVNTSSSSSFVTSKKECVSICPYSHSDIMFDFLELKLVDTFLYFEDFQSIIIDLFGSKYLWRNEILVIELFLAYSDKLNINRGSAMFSTPKKEDMAKNCLNFDNYIELVLTIHEDNIGHKSLLEHKLFKNIPTNIKKNYLIRKFLSNFFLFLSFFLSFSFSLFIPLPIFLFFFHF